MNPKLIEQKRYRLINRILRYSEVYDLAYLETQTLKELVSIQKNSLIKLRIMMKYKTRHKHHFDIMSK